MLAENQTKGIRETKVNVSLEGRVGYKRGVFPRGLTVDLREDNFSLCIFFLHDCSKTFKRKTTVLRFRSIVFQPPVKIPKQWCKYTQQFLRELNKMYKRNTFRLHR